MYVSGATTSPFSIKLKKHEYTTSHSITLSYSYKAILPVSAHLLQLLATWVLMETLLAPLKSSATNSNVGIEFIPTYVHMWVSQIPEAPVHRCLTAETYHKAGNFQKF